MPLEQVPALLGPERVASGDATRRYAVNGKVAPIVAYPGSREEAAALISRAAENGWSLVCYGGGTQIDFGFPPRKLDLVLSTERLNRVVDYQPDDMTVTVEPGVTLAELERILAERGQFLPLDPPLAERATVGGMMASAASGPWRAQFGTPRDWIIGCRVIGADGKEVRGGGQVVKNVAGYDLPKLYTGSFGTLGLITEITFKVMPKLHAAGYCRVPLETATQAEALLHRAMDSDLQPSVLELAYTGDPHSNEGQWSLFCEFLHVPEAIDWQILKLAELARDAGAEAEALDGEHGERHLRTVRDLPAQPPFVARIGSVSSRVSRIMEEVAVCCREAHQAPSIRSHAASGQILVYSEPDAGIRMIHELREIARNAGASCVFPRLPQACLEENVDPWGEVGPELRLMRGIKQKLDPTGVFSPGRFAGGI